MFKMFTVKIISDLNREEDKKMIVCAICENPFQNTQGLSAHVKPKHGISWEEYQKKHPNHESRSIKPPGKDPPGNEPPVQNYTTKEEFESLKNSTKEDLETIIISINNLAALMNEELPEIQDGEPPSNPETGIADVDNIAEVIDPSMDLEMENPLETMVDSVIELEGSIISRKSVGFTSKSLLLFDLVRKKGFRGNFADFVNSCISSALKGRKFKLVVEEEVE